MRKGPLTVELLKEAKRIEFPDCVIGRLTGKSEEEIKKLRYDNGIVAAYKMVDTCAAEFEANTPYYYSVYGSENEAVETNPPKKVLVLGSGPIRIGQGIEFDYCSVHATWAFAKAGYETIIINNNPETVSTDFDIADKLYFEPLTPEDVESIVRLEKPDGAVVQFGGQTAIKLTQSLMKMGVPILGTKAEDVDAAEDRELFDRILEQTRIPRAAGGTVYTAEQAFNEALYKAFLGAGVDLPRHKQMIITVKDADKGEAIEIGRRFEKLGYTIYATRSTCNALKEAGVHAKKVNKISQESPTVMDLILGHRIDLVIDTPTQGRDKSRDGFLIRRTAIETGVNCITAMDTARALVTSLENKQEQFTLIDVASI